jgi:hypothetical protein
MENPRSVGRFLLVVFIVATLAAVVSSILCQDYYILLGWLAVLGVFLVLCIVLGLINAVVFVPIFWLLDRLTSRRTDTFQKRGRTNDGQEEGL